jgi:hypothetical protein
MKNAHREGHSRLSFSIKHSGTVGGAEEAIKQIVDDEN